MTVAPPAPATTPTPAFETTSPPPGFWQREASHFPQPLSPAIRIFVQWENAIWQNLATKHGMMFDGIEFREINGWVYQRLRPLGGKDRKPPPGWLMWLLVRTAPPIRARLKQLQKSLAEDLGCRASNAGTASGRRSRSRRSSSSVP